VNIQTYDGPICSTAIAEGLYVRRMFFEKRGDRNDGHAHTYDHVTCLAAGAVRCTVDGVVEDFKAPHLFVTPKDAYHRFEALEAGDGAALHARPAGHRPDHRPGRHSH
jgi:quercetin dioxygenase-like cupin family protein